MSNNRVLKFMIRFLGAFVALTIGIVLIVRRIALNFKDPALKKVWEADFQEKTASINGTTLNYVESPNNGPPLLLIHGQLVLWQSYVRVLPELSQHFHVFAVDCHGHGKSARTPERYTAQAIGTDLAAFIEQVIGEPAIVSGNSSGGLLSVWLAANAPEQVVGIVPEDPPLFSSEYPRIKDTFGWDMAELGQAFLQSGEQDFQNYYLQHSRLMGFFPEDARKGIYEFIQFYKKQRPGQPVQVFFLPRTLRTLILGLGMYDPRFGANFYDGSWHKDFDHAETLARVTCPTVLMHSNWKYDENHILQGAMNAEDASRAADLLSNGTLKKVDSGHSVHIEDPDIFTDILIQFGKEHAVKQT